MIVRLKTFFFHAGRPLYVLGELFEMLTRARLALHEGAVAFIEKARRHGMLVGVVTDRSLFSFVISARRAGLPLEKLSFIHARRSCLDWLVRARIPSGVRVFTTPYYKGDERALRLLEKFFARFKFAPHHRVYLVGDDRRDRLAAAYAGFWFILVDRRRPDFQRVWRILQMSPA